MELSKKPLVSVIIPTHNSALFINETISSVLSQSNPDFEIIVVDDASADNTLKLVQSLADKDSRIRYFKQEKGGVSVARNRGIKESMGGYIAFIDHDDLWVPQKLEKQLKLFREDPQLGLVFSRAAIITNDGKSLCSTGGLTKFRRGYVFKDLFCKHFIFISSTVIKREVFDSLDEWFPESMEMAEEIDLFLRIAYNWKVDYCNEILTKWRWHSNNDSTLRKMLLINDYNKIIERLKEKIPDFETIFKKEIFRKQRWIAMTEIEILFSEENKRSAIKNTFIFFKRFGFYPKAVIKFFLLFSFGYKIYEKIRLYFLRLTQLLLRK